MCKREGSIRSTAGKLMLVPAGCIHKVHGKKKKKRSIMYVKVRLKILRDV